MTTLQSICCLHSWLCDWMGAAARCCCPASQEYPSPITILGKYQNSKVKVMFLLNGYHFRITVKSKKCKLNHHKSGTVSSYTAWFLTSFFFSFLYSKVLIKMNTKEPRKSWGLVVKSNYHCGFWAIKPREYCYEIPPLSSKFFSWSSSPYIFIIENLKLKIYRKVEKININHP